MCTFEKDGVKISADNVIISYQENIENIHPDHIADMTATKVNGWSMFLLHRTMAEIKDEIIHHHICPVNVEGIKTLIREEIAKQPKIVWTKAKKIAAIVVGILLGLTTAINFFIAIKEITK